MPSSRKTNGPQRGLEISEKQLMPSEGKMGTVKSITEYSVSATRVFTSRKDHTTSQRRQASSIHCEPIKKSPFLFFK